MNDIMEGKTRGFDGTFNISDSQSVCNADN